MDNETTLVRVRCVFTEKQRTAINMYFKKYELKFTKKKFTVTRCDKKKISKSCNYISLKDIDTLLRKSEAKYLKTKNISIKETMRAVKKMREDIVIFLKKGKQFNEQYLELDSSCGE